MNSDVITTLEDFGVHPALVALVAELPAATPCVVKEQAGLGLQYRPLSAGPNCQVAIYAEKKVLYAALEPDSATHFIALTGAKAVKPNATSTRIHISPNIAADPEKRRHLIDALAMALHLSADIDGTAAGSPSSQPTPDYGVCPHPGCGIALPATRSCDDHGGPF